MSNGPLDLWRGRALRLGFSAAAIGAATLTGMIRNKWFAVHLAPEGIGVIGQVVSTLTWLGMLAALGLGFPVARAIAAAHGADDPDAARRTARVALGLTLVTTTIVAALGLIFAVPISLAVLGDRGYAGLIRIAMIGAGGYAFHLVVQGIIGGRSDVRPPVTIAIAGGLATVIAAFALVPARGITGGVWSAVLYFPAGLLVAWLVHRRAYAGAWTPAADGGGARPELTALITVGLSSLVLALADQGAMLALRAHFLRIHGIAANGVFQAALSISTQVAALFYAYLSNYALGRLSGAGDTPGVTAYMRRQWIPVVGAALVVFALAAVAATPLLHLLFSDRFDGARPMLAWMLVGEFLRVQTLALLFGGLALGRTRRWLAGGMMYPVAFVAAYLWLGGGSILSLAHAHALGGAVGLAGTAWVMHTAGLRLRVADVLVSIGATSLLAVLATAMAR
jgi:O-antigen/teichoic acid export membrane protein